MTESERVWNAYIDAWNTHRIEAVLAALQTSSLSTTSDR